MKEEIKELYQLITGGRPDGKIPFGVSLAYKPFGVKLALNQVEFLLDTESVGELSVGDAVNLSESTPWYLCDGYTYFSIASLSDEIEEARLEKSIAKLLRLKWEPILCKVLGFFAVEAKFMGGNVIANGQIFCALSTVPIEYIIISDQYPNILLFWAGGLKKA